MISTADLFGALPAALRRRKAVGHDPVSVVSFLLGTTRLARALAFKSAPKRSATVYNACDGWPPHARTDAAKVLARSDRASLRVETVRQYPKLGLNVLSTPAGMKMTYLAYATGSGIGDPCGEPKTTK